MASQPDKDAELASLFDKLDSFVEHEQHSKALKIIDQILKLSPGDEDALRCKVVALISDGVFDEALKVLGHKRLEGKMQFERAYALYRLGRLQDALKSAGEVEDDRRSEGLQLEAQLHYRLGNAAQCIACYDRLAKEFNVDGLELKVNILAAHVAGGLSGQIPGLMSSLKITPKSSYQVAYNRACGLVESGDLSGAETALRVAIKQGGEELYDEDLAEEEILDELSPLGVMLAWVLGRMGRHAEALERLEPLVSGELSDPAAAAVAANNFVVDSYAADPHQKGFYGRAIKKLDALLDRSSSDPLALARGLATRLTPDQRQALHLNRALLYLLSGKADAARDLAGQLVKAYPDGPLVVMLQAVLLARGGKASDADKLLAGLAAKPAPAGGDDADSDDLAPQLLRVQLALEDGNLQGALAQLSALPGELPMAPGVLATRVAMLEQVGDTAGAEALMDSALAQWQQAARADTKDEAASEAVGWCLQRLVALKLQLDKGSEAIQLFMQQQQQQQGAGKRGAAARAPAAADAAVLARLCRSAAAGGDLASVAVLSRQLPGGGAEAAGKGLDPEALEDLTRALNSVRAQRRREAEADAAAGEAAGGKRRRGGAGEDGVAGEKRKRKKKPRYPKGYDPSKPNGGLPPPDPERWLPKWQRSDYKKKQKRRRDRTEGPLKGAQGAGKVDESLDRAAKGKDAVEPDAKGKGAARPNLPQRKGGKK